jgi:hypothetical protein
VLLFSLSDLRPYRCAGAFVLIALAAIASGCGSSGSTNPADGKAAGASPKQLLKEEQLYKYEGEGRAKRKEPISLRERVKLLREAKKSQ